MYATNKSTTKTASHGQKQASELREGFIAG
jgi:hypothetical protein